MADSSDLVPFDEAADALEDDARQRKNAAEVISGLRRAVGSLALTKDELAVEQDECNGTIIFKITFFSDTDISIANIRDNLDHSGASLTDAKVKLANTDEWEYYAFVRVTVSYQ